MVEALSWVVGGVAVFIWLAIAAVWAFDWLLRSYSDHGPGDPPRL